MDKGYEKIYLHLLSNRNDGVSRVPSPSMECSLNPVPNPGYDFYCQWHNSVGMPWGWHLRRRIKDRNRIEAELNATGAAMLEFCQSGQALGYCFVRSESDRQTEIADFGLLPRHTGKGIGTVFLQKVIQNLWQQGNERIWLSTRSTNHSGVIRFYSRHGFREFYRETINEKNADPAVAKKQQAAGQSVPCSP